MEEEIAVTPANVNDDRARPDALPDTPGEVFAGSVYRGPIFAEAVRARGGRLRIAAMAMWGRNDEETLARLAAFNSAIPRVRARIEKIFGTWKRSYGLRRMRWRELAKATAQVRLTRSPTISSAASRSSQRQLDPGISRRNDFTTDEQSSRA